MPTRALLLLALAAPLCAQSLSPDLPPGVLLGARIRARVKQRFGRLPEYTCLETLDRFSGARNKRDKLLDTVRLEVLFAGSQEFFDSPGGRNFKESNPGKFIVSGFIGDGLFASYLEDIFVNDNGIFQYRGDDDLDGRRVARFDFHVPSLQGGTTVQVPGARATVAFAGTFWADPATYDLIRLRIDAVDIPPILQVSQMTTTIEYAPARIGDAEILLPQSGDMLMVHDAGQFEYNRFDFTHCREYRAESAISFDDGAPAPTAAPSTASRASQSAEQSLPAGLTVAIALTAPITERSAVGDMVQGKIVGNVIARGGNSLIADGTAVHGRIRQIERAPEAGDYFSVGLEFTDIDSAAAPFRFFADFVSSDSIPGLEREIVKRNSTAGPPPAIPPPPQVLMPGWHPESAPADVIAEYHLQHPELPGVGFFFLHGPHFTLPAGFRMVWKTRAM